jgi:Icc-related predicted phosphoesterase
MRLLCITDLHESQVALERILADTGPADLILLGGDLTNFGTPADAEAMIQQAEATGTKVLAVAGNCDSAEIDQRLVELEVSLAGRGVIYAGAGLHGLSAMPPWQGNMYETTEAELARALQTGYAQIAGAGHHVVLSHPPPHGGNLDCTSSSRHVGSRALRSFIDQVQPELVVCGHIHEARGLERLGRTTVVNCGPAAAGYYALAELAEVDEDPKVELCRV